ncbi:MAG: YqgE/AlgH family protein [Candidatus Hydrogenedentota bacterium]
MNTTIEKGKLLIAHPFLLDPNFIQTVVLVIEYEDEGAFGLVMNRPLELTVDKLSDSLGISWGGSDPAPNVCLGGPVETQTVWVVHDGGRGIGVASEVVSHVAFSSSAPAIRSMLMEPAGRFRICLGYSGWGPGQLEKEMEGGYWLLADATPELVFDIDPAAMWLKAMQTTEE